MALPRYSIRLEDLGALRVLAENLNDPRGIMTSVGALHKGMVEDRLHNEGKPRHAFPARMVPNIPGLIADFRKSKNPKSRRFVGRPVLFDTGGAGLAGSIAFDVTGPRTVETGTNLDYAETQHEGGESESEVITEKMQENLWTFLKSDRGSAWQNDLGWMLNPKFVGQTVTIKVRARPFVDLDEDDLDETEELLAEGLFLEGGQS